MEEKKKDVWRRAIMEEKKKDVVYGVVMILFLIIGLICGFVLSKQTISVKDCNDFFGEWINRNCECTEEIRDKKLIFGDWIIPMEVPLLNETN